MEKEGEFRITTVATAILATQLDSSADGDHLDDALHDAGYARLDHGSAPGETVAITPVTQGIGRDPGHRANTLETLRALMHVVRADGRPAPARLATLANAAERLAPTDAVGQWLCEVNLAYALRRDDAPAQIPPEVWRTNSPDEMAKTLYAAASWNGTVTDVALERALAASDQEGWAAAIWAAHPAHEPVVRVKRNDPGRLEALGMDPAVAELVTWVQTHPEVTVARFTAYAGNLGLDQQRIAEGIGQALRLENNVRSTRRREDPPPR